MIIFSLQKKAVNSWLVISLRILFFHLERKYIRKYCKKNVLEAWGFLVGGIERDKNDKEGDNKTLSSIAVQSTLKTVGK